MRYVIGGRHWEFVWLEGGRGGRFHCWLIRANLQELCMEPASQVVEEAGATLPAQLGPLQVQTVRDQYGIHTTSEWRDAHHNWLRFPLTPSTPLPPAAQNADGQAGHRPLIGLDLSVCAPSRCTRKSGRYSWLSEDPLCQKAGVKHARGRVIRSRASPSLFRVMPIGSGLVQAQPRAYFSTKA